MRDVQPLSDIQVFSAYAESFELAYLDDNWKPVRAWFDDEAVYRVDAPPPIGGEWTGGDAIVAHLVESVNSFDRTYDQRLLELLAGPEMENGAVFVRWAVTYKKAGVPDMRMEGEERAWIRDGKIARLEDSMPSA